MSHKNDVLNYLKQGNTITQLGALQKFGCGRLAPRIHELRKEGYHIRDLNKENSDERFAKYKLVRKRKPQQQAMAL